ncbi:MAG: TonB-dependent receptor [Flavobacteriales bacterium]
MKFILVWCALCIAVCTFAQSPSHVLHGRVTDGDTGMPLADVHVFMHEAETSTRTDASGHFFLPGLGAGRHHIHVERIGYKAAAEYVTIPLPADSVWELRLYPTSIELSQAVIEHSLSRSEQRSNTLAVIRIGADDLDRNREVTLAQSLTRIPGIQVIQTGVSIARPVVRGLSGNRILVQDLGMRQEGQQWGSDHGLEIDPYLANRIEIIKGPGVLLFGPEAMGGVIHILPPAVPEPGMRGTVHTTMRSANSLWGSSFMLEGNRKGYFFRTRMTIQEYGDYKVPADRFTYLRRVLPIEGNRLKNTAGKELHGALTLGYSGKGGSVKWTNTLFQQQAGLFPGIVGVPTAGSLADDGDPRNVDLPRFAIDHFKSAINAVIRRPKGWLQLDGGVQQNVRSEQIFPRREGFAPIPDDAEAYRLRVRSSQVTMRWHSNSEGPWKWIPGVSAQWMGHRRFGRELLLPDYNQWMAGAFLTAEYTQSPRTTWSGGLRYDAGHFSNASDSVPVYAQGEIITGYDVRMTRTDQRFGAISAGLGWSHSPGETWNIKLHAGKSFRPPNAAERSINGVHHGTFRHEQGDGSLRPEHGYQLDASLSRETRSGLISISPYVNYFSGYIYLRPAAQFSTLPEGGQLYRYTQHNAIFTGAELQAEWHPVEALHLEAGADYVFTYNTETGLALPFSPPLRAQAYAEYEWESGRTDSRITRAYAGVRGIAVAAQHRTDRNEAKTPGYVLAECSAGADVRLGKQVADVRVVWANALNTRYMNHLSIYRQLNLPEQGSNVSVVIKIPFEL